MEEGRIRVITPVSQPGTYDGLAIDGNLTLPDGKKGVYDYFILDYQKNVRMLLTEETHSAYNTCTMETSRATTEDAIFGQSGAANEVEATRSATPAGWQTVNTTASVSKLGNNAGHNIGPNTLQKVMAGDQVSATVQYYYQDPASGSNPNFVSTLLTSLGLAIAGSPVADNMVKANTAGITSGLNGTSGFLNAVQPTGSGGTTPQAYLTILFFDERFKFIEAVDGGVAQQQVATSGAGASPLALGSIKAPKNGYAYVYVSNRSDQDVYFDDLQVGINRGNIIEEDHYYVYGLKIAAISSRKPADINEGKVKNDYLYNGQELTDDADLNWYDYGFRNYDAQIGRFVQMDPITDHLPIISPYIYAYNDPVTYTDKFGLIGGGIVACPGTSAFSLFLSSVGSAISGFLATASGTLSTINTIYHVSLTAASFTQSIQTSNMINGQVTTVQVGLTIEAGSVGSTPSPSSPGSSGAPGSLDFDLDDDQPDQQQPGPRLVFYPVFEDLTPQTYAHIKEATTTGGKPLLLHYGGFSKTEKNKIRNENTKVLDPKSDEWRDEYPFACTIEAKFGGSSVMYINAEEQRIQAIEMRIVTAGLKAGDMIQVVLIPKMSKAPVLKPKPSLTIRRLRPLKNEPEKWTPQYPVDPQPVPVGQIVTNAAAGATILTVLYYIGMGLLIAL